MTSKIAVRGLYKFFGDDLDAAYELLDQGYTKERIFEETGVTVGVNDVSFDVAEGEIFVVMGLSGSGKSTLIRMLNRLIEPTAGEVTVAGQEITQMSRQELMALRRDRMSMVFQHFALLPHRTVAENAAFGLKLRGVGRDERRERALKVLAQVGLREWADSLPQQLSGGMQQRVGLSRALAADTDILLMDEPFSALDPLIRRDMQDELLTLQRSMHKTIVFITHDLNEALILGDRIAIMRAGVFVQTGTPEEIVATPADDYVAAFTRDVDRSRVFTASKLMRWREPLVLERDSLDTASERLREYGANAVHVVDTQGVPIGLVRAEALRDQHAEDALDEVMVVEFPRCRPDDHLHEVYELCARGLPIAVIDADDRLCGVLDPLDVFAQLAGGDDGSEAGGSAAAGTDAAAESEPADARAGGGES
ncbi:quaternary amine ABC transporter ATP-binding protein [Arhodomonas sp. AD133]|uniref:quaternary amine ABC transporter ATP-binding protein n=1 Tax=Arhodomonas sp. AD133 TaxID=3415009 RepID=UPI003EC0D4C2